MLDPDKNSLYQRLGGYDGIAAIVEDMHPRMENDPQLSMYWRGKCNDSLVRDRQLVIDFLCAAFGGPLAYRGRDMKISHEGLAISESDWNLFVEHTRATLDKLAIPEQEQEEFLAAAGSLKGEVVEVASSQGARVR